MRLDFLNDYDFFTGVPDSLLSPLCNYLMDRYGLDPKHHIIAANEGNCVALAAGYHLSTGNVPVVYLQNSGIGNMINPVASLMNDKVYAIPCIFIVGWRGEPGVHDEPQHVFQGKVTVKLLEDMDIRTFIIDTNTAVADVSKKLAEWSDHLKRGKQVAFIVKKNALEYDKKPSYHNNNTLMREDVIKTVVKFSGEDNIVSTTGKTSRELFEVREQNGQEHGKDFLTVGSMGHSSSIAFEIALQNQNKKIWCIDGDGAALMHMGSMATIGAYKPNNLVHILINNTAHESVGGLPTVADKIDFVRIASACGYPSAVCVEDMVSLQNALEKAKNSNELMFLEVKCAIGSRADLGRPTTSAKDNKLAFMASLKE